jgi:hypothetical protein
MTVLFRGCSHCVLADVATVSEIISFRSLIIIITIIIQWHRPTLRCWVWLSCVVDCTATLATCDDVTTKGTSEINFARSANTWSKLQLLDACFLSFGASGMKTCSELRDSEKRLLTGSLLWVCVSTVATCSVLWMNCDLHCKWSGMCSAFSAFP